VSFLKPGDDDGHPGYSTMYTYENFVARAVAAVQNNPQLWRNTAIIITEDESGGYYDSGYIQPVSFFGDGPRIPMQVVSPYARQGFVDHTYTDHVSILTFIEANWGPEAADLLQRGQHAERDARGLCAEGPARDRQPHDNVQLPESALRHDQAAGPALVRSGRGGAPVGGRVHPALTAHL
jgi:hypothetical protein